MTPFIVGTTPVLQRLIMKGHMKKKSLLWLWDERQVFTQAARHFLKLFKRITFCLIGHHFQLFWCQVKIMLNRWNKRIKSLCRGSLNHDAALPSHETKNTTQGANLNKTQQRMVRKGKRTLKETNSGKIPMYFSGCFILSKIFLTRLRKGRILV